MYGVIIREQRVPARYMYLLEVEATASHACHISLQFNLGAEACSSSSTEPLGLLEPKKKSNKRRKRQGSQSKLVSACSSSRALCALMCAAMAGRHEQGLGILWTIAAHRCFRGLTCFTGRTNAQETNSIKRPWGNESNRPLL